MSDKERSSLVKLGGRITQVIYSHNIPIMQGVNAESRIMKLLITLRTRNKECMK